MRRGTRMLGAAAELRGLQEFAASRRRLRVLGHAGRDSRRSPRPPFSSTSRQPRLTRTAGWTRPRRPRPGHHRAQSHTEGDFRSVRNRWRSFSTRASPKPPGSRNRPARLSVGRCWQVRQSAVSMRPRSSGLASRSSLEGPAPRQLRHLPLQPLHHEVDAMGPSVRIELGLGQRLVLRAYGNSPPGGGRTLRPLADPCD